MNAKTWAPLVAAIVMGAVAAKVGLNMLAKRAGPSTVTQHVVHVVIAKENIVPGSAIKPSDVSVGTVPEAINQRGTVTGWYYDASGDQHGFLLDRNGKMTTFDFPGSEVTHAETIDPIGVIAGLYGDASGVVHGFLQNRAGALTTFDPPGSLGTFPFAINSAGEITGTYNASDGGAHGFLRHP